MDKDMTLDRADADGMKVYTVHIQADSPEDLSLRTTKFFGQFGQRGRIDQQLCRGKSPKKQLKIRSYFYEDHINLEKFLGSAAVSDGIVYRMEYPKGYVAAFEEGNHADMVTEGKYADMYNKRFDHQCKVPGRNNECGRYDPVDSLVGQFDIDDCHPLF